LFLSSGLKITAGQWPDKMLFKTIFDWTFLIFEGRLIGQVLILAGYCPLTGRYFEPWVVNNKESLTLFLKIDNILLQLCTFCLFCSPELIATGVMELIQDETKNAAVMRITKQKGIDYKKYVVPKL